MLIDLFPRDHTRFTSLPLLGPHLDDLACWLDGRGLARDSIRGRIRKAPHLATLLQQRDVRSLGLLSRAQLVELAPPKASDNLCLSSLVRSLATFLDDCNVLARSAPTPAMHLAGTFRDHLVQVRGLAVSTARNHVNEALALLEFLHFNSSPAALRTLVSAQLDEFVKLRATCLGRATLRHSTSRLRSFLRFLADRGAVAPGSDAWVDSPRTYRSEQLPRALPWETVRAFLAGIDRTTATGRRDYALLLLVASYGLRCSEAAALRLDDIACRTATLHVTRPKARSPIVLPLTHEVGAALLDYLRQDRPQSPHREVFLRRHRPIEPLSPAGVRSAFNSWKARSGLEIPSGGPHCLRHSVALRLLRQNTALAEIGALLGHRRTTTTYEYLRLHEDDLRTASLNLPVRKENAR